MPPGDEQVQDALMEQLRLQVTSQTLKEEIKEGMEGKKEEIKELGEKVRATGREDTVSARAAWIASDARCPGNAGMPPTQ